MPPPAKCGARIEPCRARPVPFWRHGFAPPPRTLPRVLVDAVPWRRALSSARTDSWTSGPWKRAPKATSSRSTLPEPPSTLALAIGAHLHHAVARPGDRAADHQQVVAHVDAHDLEAALRDALVAHLARPADALEHARGVGGGADRTRRAHVVRAVAHGAAGEVVALDRALEALALRDAGDLDLLAGLEGLDRDGLTDGQLAGLVAELDDVLHRRRVGLAQMPELGLGDVLLAYRAERELDGLVAVAVERADPGDGTRAGLEHRDALDAPGLEEQLGHPELLGEDRRHQPASRISMSTPAGRWSRRWSESTVFGVGWWMSISRLCVRISKCSRESLSLNGDRITQYTFFSVGSGTGPDTVAPVRVAVSTISLAAVSMAEWSYAFRRMRILFWVAAAIRSSVFCLPSGERFVLALCAPKADPKRYGARPTRRSASERRGHSWSYPSTTR